MATKYENQETFPGVVYQIYSGRRTWQSFTPQAAHEITSVFLHGYKKGNPGNIHIRIRLADGEHKPTGDDLAVADQSANGWTLSSAGAWYEIPLDAAYELEVDTEYGIEAWCDGTSVVVCLYLQGATSGNPYPRGLLCTTTTSGSSWTVQATRDEAFQEWGDPVLDPPTVATNPADGVDHEQATLHGTLTDDGGEACEVRFQYGKTVGYGTDTEWQPGKVSTDTFEQLITGLDPDQLYHFRAQAKNAAGTSSASDAEFTTSILPPAYGAMKKAQITHPALKTVRIIQHGQEVGKFDQLSNPDEAYIESGLTLSIPTPSTVEVTTLADQVYEFNIPEA